MLKVTRRAAAGALPGAMVNISLFRSIIQLTLFQIPPYLQIPVYQMVYLTERPLAGQTLSELPLVLVPQAHL